MPTAAFCSMVSPGPCRRPPGWTGVPENGHDLDAVLLLEAPDDVLMERMLARGRADDTAEAISRRLALSLGNHAAAGALRQGAAGDNGVGTVDEVQQRALAALKDGPAAEPIPADPQPVTA